VLALVLSACNGVQEAPAEKEEPLGPQQPIMGNQQPIPSEDSQAPETQEEAVLPVAYYFASGNLLGSYVLRPKPQTRKDLGRLLKVRAHRMMLALSPR